MPGTQCYYVEFADVVIHEDGSCEIDLTNYDVPYYDRFIKKAFYGRYSFSYNNYYYYGFETIEALVQSKSSDYEDGYTLDWAIEGVDDMTSIIQFN